MIGCCTRSAHPSARSPCDRVRPRARARPRRRRGGRRQGSPPTSSPSTSATSLVITDAFVVASAPNDRQVGAIVDAVEEALRAHGAKPLRREGEREGRWVLLDYAEVVVHVQHDEERTYYALERLWKDCPSIEPARARAGASSRVRRRRAGGPPVSARRQVLLLRHGQTAWNAAGRFQGQEDIGLDETGRAQAARAAKRLVKLHPHAVVASDLCRAWDTAAALGARTGLPVTKDERLRETYAGRRQGMTMQEIDGRYGAERAAWRSGHDVRPGGDGEPAPRGRGPGGRGRRRARSRPARGRAARRRLARGRHHQRPADPPRRPARALAGADRSRQLPLEHRPGVPRPLDARGAQRRHAPRRRDRRREPTPVWTSGPTTG
ncbi:hypothetical protein GCM10025868_09450 [Angustibacter aerolatus]|uniref:Ribosomal silencing factor RsfS n=1 Tax=Angustibacter aerolatus TaxID=1162965 RepID=A0ABQ6JBY6_9ACTN|nr:ribosome silencing factor [Angustibacter aerolatus]GMA85695.1 hypothetical protein GCM10025868_09450 [Angustibacter aerolatus]